MPDSAGELAVAAAFAGPHGDQVLPGRELHVGQVQGGGLAEAQASKGPDQLPGPTGPRAGPSAEDRGAGDGTDLAGAA